MTIKIYRDNDRLVVHDQDISKLYNFPVGEMWYQMVNGEIQFLRGQSVLFNGQTYDTVKDFMGVEYSLPADIHDYLSEALFTPINTSSSNFFEFNLPAGVGGQYTIQDAQTEGQVLQMAAMTYETGTNYSRYGFRKYDILTTPESVTGFQIETSINNGNVVNISGIFKDLNGNLILNVNAAPWPITFTIKLFVVSTI